MGAILWQNAMVAAICPSLEQPRYEELRVRSLLCRRDSISPTRRAASLLRFAHRKANPYGPAITRNHRTTCNTCPTKGEEKQRGRLGVMCNRDACGLLVPARPTAKSHRDEL